MPHAATPILRFGDAACHHLHFFPHVPYLKMTPTNPAGDETRRSLQRLSLFFISRCTRSLQLLERRFPESRIVISTDVCKHMFTDALCAWFTLKIVYIDCGFHRFTLLGGTFACMYCKLRFRGMCSCVGKVSSAHL